MTTSKIWLAGLVALTAFVTGCSSDEAGGSTPDGGGGGNGSGDGGDEPTADCPVVVRESDCDKTQRPFVFVHGTFGSGDNMAHVASLLGSNGFCQDRIVAVEYNSLGETPGTDGQIDDVVNQVLADNPDFDQVDIAGHSQGTRHVGEYLAVPANAAKVAHYINFSGVPNVGDVETLSLSSQRDLVMDTGLHATGTNVTEVTFEDEDHFAVAASDRAFVEVYKYLTGNDPEYVDVQCGEEMVTVEGIAETFADNFPIHGRLEIREMTNTPRAEEEPVVVIEMGDPDGHFGPLQLKRNVGYEFKGYDNDGTLVGWVYFAPFKRSNYLTRLLTPPNTPAIAAASTDHVVRGPNHVALVVRWAGGAFRHDLGASLTIDGTEILNDENSGNAALASQELRGGTVAMFLNDSNESGESDLNLYYKTSFLAFSDVFMDTATPEFVELKFTAGSEDPGLVDQTVKISNWPSDEGQVLVMFQ